MEDQVPFKVYAHWSEGGKPEVRRFGVERSVVTSFHYLNAKLQDVYPGLRNRTYTVAWKDEDGDDVVISSDDEVMVALSQMNGGDVIKLYVYCKEMDIEIKEIDVEVSVSPLMSTGGTKAGDKTEHMGVVCDGCDRDVVGYRYKCTSCDDYDLCATCEAAGVHPEHCMVRIPTPTMPHALIKAAIKRSRNFLKTVAVKEECPYKKNRRERSGDKHHREGDAHHRHGEGHRQGEGHQGHQGHHRHNRRGQRGSWLETFATYMNEFADLAGDMTNQEPKKSDTAAPTTAEQPQTTTQQNGEPGTTEQNAPQPPQCPIRLEKIINPENVKCLMELQKHLAEMLVPNLNPEPSTTSTTASTSTTATTVNTTIVGPQASYPQIISFDVEIGQGDRKSPESDRDSEHSAASASGANSKMSEPAADKTDGWTMINKENDLMDAATARMPTPLAPQKPVGFDLPEEFAERVRLNEAQSLYPPLHLATAQLNPKEPQAPTAPLQPQSQPQPQPQPQSQSQPQPTASPPKPPHPKAHIAAAISHMLAMGFNNDGGWLTQLLENYDGNISAVLDLLTPVAPKKK